MHGFRTARSTYYMDNRKKIISGGKLGNRWYVYKEAKVIVGCRARIVLITGKVLETGVVIEYI